jgi:hypothetical protein
MTLQDLEKRLSEATGADRWWTTAEADDWTLAVFGPKATFTDWGMLIAAFTSLDAAIALCERVLPDWHLCVQGVNKAWSARLNPTAYGKVGDGFANHAFPALALCLAVVRALIAKDTKSQPD